MNKNDFNRFISGGLVPGRADLEGTRELTSLFPWFHSAHLVLLRGLRESSDIKFESQLKGSALYVADRAMLYSYLFMNAPESAVGDNVQVTEPAENTPQSGLTEEAPEEKIPEPEVIPEIITAEPADEPAEIADLPVEEPAAEPAEIAELPAEEPAAEPAEIADLPADEPVQTEDNMMPIIGSQGESHTEDTAGRSRDELIAEIEARLVEIDEEDLLELTAGEEITGEGVINEEIINEETQVDKTFIDEGISEEVTIEKPLKQLSPNDLIDRFIQTSPRIERMTPGEVSPVRDLTEEKAGDHSPFITETLARIYVNQGYYTKAINIYEKLSLQFPEKSAYFASRIEKIKELIK